MLISIIMPAYNAEKYIALSIDSVLAQTYPNWELIIVDDGSTDNTASIVKGYVIKDYRIKYIYQKNGKQAKARNNGITNAKGYILAFLDSDDVWLPEKLEISLSNFDTNKYDLLFTNSYYTSDENIDVRSHTYAKMHVISGVYSNDEALKQFIQVNRIPTLTVLVKKEKVLELGGFDSRFVPAEDYDLWIRLLKNGSVFIAIDLVLSIYRLIDESSTAKDRFATDSVLKCLNKNFSFSEIKRLKEQTSIINWAKMFVELHLHDFKTNKNLIIYLWKFNVLSPKMFWWIISYGYSKLPDLKDKIIKAL